MQNAGYTTAALVHYANFSYYLGRQAAFMFGTYQVDDNINFQYTGSGMCPLEGTGTC